MVNVEHVFLAFEVVKKLTEHILKHLAKVGQRGHVGVTSRREAKEGIYLSKWWLRFGNDARDACWGVTQRTATG